MVDYEELLQVAIAEAKIGLAEGGVPVGACLADENGDILGRGHNQRVQESRPPD
jgi:creatinine deaminase